MRNNDSAIVQDIVKMKLLCLVALAVCVVVHGANLQDDIVAPGLDITKDLGRSQYNLIVRAPNYEEIQGVAVPVENSVGENRIISGAIGNILEQLRDVVINGNDDIPPLDPLVVPVLGPYQYVVATGINGQATINNLRVEGLRWFVADRIDINPLRLSVGMTVTVPWLTVTGSYEARARLGLITHTAGGNFRVFAHRIEVGFDMRMGTNLFGGGHLILRELDIHIDIHDTQISITGMTGSSLINAFISSTIQSVTQDFIQTELEHVSARLSEELFDVINDVLKDYTISDIFG